jgi:hypothetical protein
MKFMLMMQGTQAGWESMSKWPPAEVKAHIEFMIGFAQDLSASGELVLAEGLDLPKNAKVVKARKGGAPLVTDGPFLESKEFLAGVWIVDVPTAKRAIEIAAAASAAPGPGGQPLGIPIEVRQVGSAPEM